MQIRTTKRSRIRGVFSGINKRLVGLVALFLIVLGGGITYYFANADAPIAGTKVEIAQASGKLHHGQHGDDKYTHLYQVTYTAGEDNTGNSGSSYNALCAEANKDTPDKVKSKVYDLSQEISTLKYEQIKRILLLTYAGRGPFNGATAYNASSPVFNWGRFSSFTTVTSFKNRSIALGHVLVSYVYSGSAAGTGFSNDFAHDYWDGNDGLIQEIYDIFESEPYKSLAESVVVRRSEGTTSSGDKQDLVWLEGISAPPPPSEGEVGVQKINGDPEHTPAGDYYQLSGAVFEVYPASQCTGGAMETDSEDGAMILDGECTGEPVATLTTGADGKTDTVTLPVGIYYIKEKTSPRGFRLNTDFYQAFSIDGETEWLNIPDDPIVGGVRIKKVDSETLAITPQGGAKLVGTKFKLQDMTHSTTVTDSLTIGNDGYAEYEGLAPGRYKITEVSAAAGYKKTTTSKTFTIADNISEDNAIVDLTGDPFKDEVYRGNVKFTKLAEDYGCKKDSSVACEPLGGVPFVIENTDTGEKHVVISDENGVVDTSVISHTTNVNANDGLINNSYGTIVSSGIWFGESSAKSDSKGALPYGNYKITELRTAKNEPWKLLEGATAISFKIESDGTTPVDKGTFTDELVDNPTLGTTATSQSGEKKVEVGERVKIKDRISYSGLTAGKTYSVVVELVDKSNSSSNTNYRTVTLYDGEGSPAHSVEIGGLVAGSGGSGTWDIELTFDSADFIGQELVVFEELWRGDIWIGEHKNLSDSGQTITVKEPEVLRTVATTNTADDNAKAVGAGKVTVYDKVTLKGLVNGETYTVKTTAKLEDGTAIKLLDGNNKVDDISNSFNYSGTSGAEYPYPVTLHIDTAAYGGKKIVLYQQLLAGSKNYGTWPNNSSSSAEKAAETITVNNPGLSTIAFDGISGTEGDKEIKIGSDAKIRDKVHYTNLVNGTKYYLTGKVVDGSGNTVAHMEGNNLVEKEASGSEGDWYLDFTVDTRRFNGQKLTIYEYLYADSNGATEMAKHAENMDANNKAMQTVDVASVSIGTKAWVGSEGVKTAGVGTVTVSDTVEYVGLTNNDYYKLSGELVLVENGAVKEVVSSNVVRFQAHVDAEPKGSTVIAFENIDTKKYIGKTLVVREILYPDKQTVTADDEITRHDSLTDANQTITVLDPEIGTVAFDGGGNNESDISVNISSSVKIKDKIHYKNLTTGVDYWLAGKVVDIASGAILKNVDKTKYTATAAEGDWYMEFNDIDVRRYVGKKLVVYEYLYMNQNDANPTISHERNDDAGKQVINVDSLTIQTTAKNYDKRDAAEGSQNVGVGEVNLVDYVKYRGLKEGEEYWLKAEIKKQGDETNSIASGTKRFAAAADGEANPVEIRFNEFDTTELSGRTLYITETLYSGTEGDESNSIKLGEHVQDVESQRIYVQAVGLETVGADISDSDDGDKSLGVGVVTIRDTISFRGLVPGEDYTFETKIVDKNGRNVSEYAGVGYSLTDQTIRADDSGAGTKVVTIVLDDTVRLKNAGVDSITIYEYLKYKDKIIAKHEERPDEENKTQTLDIETPTLSTEAESGTLVEGNGKKVVALNEEAEIIDVAHYTGLVKGTKYKLTGVLMEQKVNEDGSKYAEELLIDGERITAEEEFTVGEGEYGVSGDVRLTFELDSTGIPGKDIVVYETLYRIKGEGDDEEEIEVVKHEEPDSYSQWVEIQPKVGTKVVDKIDNDQAVGIGKVNVVDTVSYEGLRVGKKYLLRGVMMDKKTGLPLKQTLDYSVTNDSGAEASAGTGTEAGAGTETEAETIEITLNNGIVLYAVNGEVINEAEDVEGYTIFTVGEEGHEEIDGEVQVEFEFETDQIQGKELVVFEELYELVEDGEKKEAGTIRTEHKDLEDPAQLVLVKVAGMGTTAMDAADDDKELAYGEEVEVRDLVEYSGLVRGEKYKLVGNLVDKENPTLSVAYAEAEFVAENENGEYIITFNLNTNDMSGKELVAFERLYYINDEKKEVEIAKHEDLNDQKQTVWVKIFTPNTGIFGAITDGGKIKNVSIIAVVIGALGGVYAILNRKRKIKF